MEVRALFMEFIMTKVILLSTILFLQGCSIAKAKFWFDDCDMEIHGKRCWDGKLGAWNKSVEEQTDDNFDYNSYYEEVNKSG